MKGFNKFFACTILCIVSLAMVAQNSKQLTQTVRGIVTDKASGEPLPFATVALAGTTNGVTTNDKGMFVINQVPLGRHNFLVNFMGYAPALIEEILVVSAKENYLEVQLTELVHQMDEIVVTPNVNKGESLNEMALIGARMFSTEEASRFAGGLDDPARLASSFAGVAPQSGSSNGISIHGNSPGLLQWRLEDIEVPNPNHFAEMEGLGGGFLSSLSSNVLGNSNFFIGASPAEYSNAISGVFDMKLRNGSSHRYQNTFQFGVLGIDFASEGPISRKHHSSYIVNYRYSTTGLIGKLNKDAGGVLDYQDLNFKLNFPTQKAGTFSVWGTGLADKGEPIEQDPSEWKYMEDGYYAGGKQRSGASGLSHYYLLGNRKTSIKSTLAATHMSNKFYEDFCDLNDNRSPRMKLNDRTTHFILTSAVNHKFSAWHTNKTGFTYTNINYDKDFDFADGFGEPLKNRTNTDGSANLISAYTNSLIHLNNFLELNIGLTGQYFSLNKKGAIEPRASLKWQFMPKSSLAVGYGLHSRTEKADAYFVKDENGNMPNKNLDFIKSHHFMLSYVYRISDQMNLKIEPYYQPLYNVGITEGGSYAIINRKNFYMTEILVNQGKARNYGVDITFEKYLSKGLYYLVTASLFDSKYRGGDKVWYNTRYNRKFVVNGLIGKEWILGRNILGANFKGSYMGGQRYTPVDEAATLADPEKVVHYDESKMYAESFSPMFLANFTVSYKINRKKLAHEFALKSINTTRQKEYIEHRYNIKAQKIEPFKRANSVINVYYKLEF